MRISALLIKNIRAIAHVELSDIADVVLIAGPNGCGKSCIFDSIRLLKSCYGGYQQNEWQQWFGEYGINLNRDATGLKYLFRDKSKPIHIEAEFQLTRDERDFLHSEAPRFAERMAWQIVAPHAVSDYRMRPIAQDIRAYQPNVDRHKEQILQAISDGLAEESHVGRVLIDPEGIDTVQNPLLEVLFSSYEPGNIGIIDFHGANRAYAREHLGNINLSVQATDDRERGSHLYNSAQKYTNIKSEMATSYVRELLAEKAGVATIERENIASTLRDLFQTFFPDKQFLGPVPASDNLISFPVRLSSGVEHDINDLSSGEKEVLFGYLRLRNRSPRNSVILLDEPEMHLNPGLIKGLPQFYKRHIGEELRNQIWLVTHSDAFLREAVGDPGFSVFHMRTADQVRRRGKSNQLASVEVPGEVERAVIDLVGDLAMFSPGNPVVIFEGANSEFDLKMTCRLFPELEGRTNPISAGSKTNARKLHALLRNAGERAALADKFFTIVDRDHESVEDAVGLHQWPVYHIENFLLSGRFVRAALSDIARTEGVFSSDDAVEEALREAASATLPSLVRHRMQNFVNDTIVSAIKIRADRSQSSSVESLSNSLEDSVERISALSSSILSRETLRDREARELGEFREALKGQEWKSSFRGRDVLKQFVSMHCMGVFGYEVLRDLIVARMRDSNFRPPGMEAVIKKVLASAEAE